MVKSKYAFVLKICNNYFCVKLSSLLHAISSQNNNQTKFKVMRDKIYTKQNMNLYSRFVTIIMT